MAFGVELLTGPKKVSDDPLHAQYYQLGGFCLIAALIVLFWAFVFAGFTQRELVPQLMLDGDSRALRRMLGMAYLLLGGALGGVIQWLRLRP